MIESKFSRNYFREDKFDIFFEKVFSLGNQHLLYDLPIFEDWITYDLKYIIQVLTKQKSLLNMSKFVVFMKVEDDPEIIELLCDIVCKRVKTLTTDELLEIIVNLSHTLHPSVVDVNEQANSEFVERLSDNFNP